MVVVNTEAIQISDPCKAISLAGITVKNYFICFKILFYIFKSLFQETMLTILNE